MSPHLVTIDFRFDRDKCDANPELIPLCTPEGIAADREDISVFCQKEDRDDQTQCIAQKTVNNSGEDNDDAQEEIDRLKRVFSHLPGFDLVDSEFKRVEPEADPPVADSPIKQFKLQCHFKSTIPFTELVNRFKKHIADGYLVGNGTISNEFIAFVSLEAVSSDGLEDAVIDILERAFASGTREPADAFYPITVKLL